MLVVYTQQWEFAYTPDIVIGSFFSPTVYFLLVTNSDNFSSFFLGLLLTSIATKLLNICQSGYIVLHSSTASADTHKDRPAHTQLILHPSPSSIKKPPFDIRWTWWTARALGTKPGLHTRRLLPGGHLHFSQCVFTDSDTISCSVWRAFDCKLGTEM